MRNKLKNPFWATVVFAAFFVGCKTNKTISKSRISQADPFVQGFISPPDSSGPGVYWYFMDGNLSGKGMTEDLESMKKAGITNVIFLEVNVGLPRGSVDFLSEEWQELFKHAVAECKRLGIKMTLGIGPGWTGSGGPWVAAKESMQHLVSSSTIVSAFDKRKIVLPVPAPKKPYFGEGGFTPELKEKWLNFYEDVAVLAFPTPAANNQIDDVDEKALYYRAPYSSVPGVKQYIPSYSTYAVQPKNSTVPKKEILDLTNLLQPDGSLNWTPPSGIWTVMRFGRRNNGAVTRPAPLPGLGFEADKFDTTAINKHLDEYIGKLIRKIGRPDPKSTGGLKMLHMDSWEMGAQNWTAAMRKEFTRRRGYDPLPFYPVYAGKIVESLEVSERFLWDLRLTSQELILENHANAVKKYANKYGLGLSIEPYDMNPTADLELGAVADIPMCEFWSKDFGFNSSFSCIEATSIAHVNGIAEVRAEAFTAEKNEGWKQYPGSMKDQGDWAFAAGINRFFYHTFQHQPLSDNLRPGMTMGPYGVHWDRGQTWWSMVGSYHRYITRCQFILQQGSSVADILYLTPEGAPHVFRPPASALIRDEAMPDRREYNFDGCSPGQLLTASVKDDKIVFPGGASYWVLVLPLVKTMTPALIEKVRALIADGATVMGIPPEKSASLSGFPGSDAKVRTAAAEVWGSRQIPAEQTERQYGKGKIIWGGMIGNGKEGELYPPYNITKAYLQKMGVNEDFKTTAPLRYTHRTTNEGDIYFVSNSQNEQIKAACQFRSTLIPELWDPVTGEIRPLPEYTSANGTTSIDLQFFPYQSFFIVFRKTASNTLKPKKNFADLVEEKRLNGSWEVAFDPKWGGPQKVVFDSLTDWTLRAEKGIKYYSGTAVYRKTFDLDSTLKSNNNGRIYLDLGEVNNLARVSLNGKELGVVWTAPWRVDITNAIKQKANSLKIEVVNLWANRLIGDENLPPDGITGGKWPDWLHHPESRPSGRYTFTTYSHYKKDSPLLKSGLIGPVSITREISNF